MKGDGKGNGNGTSLLGLKFQRSKQLITDTLDAVTRDIEGLVRQYLNLAGIHSFPDIDPLDYAVIPREDEGEMRVAIGSLIAFVLFLVLGTFTSTILALLTMEFTFTSRGMFFVTAVAVFVMIGKLLAYILQHITNSTPENPNADRVLRLLSLVFGVLLAASAIVAGWLRFIVAATGFDPLLVSAIVFGEFSLFSLGAVFECRYEIYRWSRHITKKYNSKEAERERLLRRKAQRELYLGQLQVRPAGVGSTS